MAKAEYYIYKALQEYSDKNNPLSQTEILDIIINKYGFQIERKAIRRNLAEIASRDNHIHYTKSIRKTNGKNQIVMSDFYIERDFSDEELKLLIDCVLFSQQLTSSASKKLATKLSDMGSLNLNMKIGNIEKISSNPLHTDNNNIFKNLEQINKALLNETMVSFIYGEYSSDKKLHPISTEPIIANPLYTITVDGKYYLICKRNGSIENYRIDYIIDIKSLKHGAKYEYFDINNYLSEHQGVYVGNQVRVTMKTNIKFLSEIIDHFGTDFDILKENPEDETLEIRLRSNENDVYYWALQNGENTEILSPQKLRDRLRLCVDTMHSKYTVSFADEYSQAILEACNSKKLSFHTEIAEKRTDHKKFTDLCSIQLYGHINEKFDVSFIRNNRELQELYICGVNIPDTAIIENLAELKILNISDQRFDDWSFLSKLTNLVSLSFKPNGPDDIKPLLNLKNFKKVNISGYSSLETAEYFRDNLPEVEVYYCEFIKPHANLYKKRNYRHD